MFWDFLESIINYFDLTRNEIICNQIKWILSYNSWVGLWLTHEYWESTEKPRIPVLFITVTFVCQRTKLLVSLKSHYCLKLQIEPNKFHFLMLRSPTWLSGRILSGANTRMACTCTTQWMWNLLFVILKLFEKRKKGGISLYFYHQENRRRKKKSVILKITVKK